MGQESKYGIVSTVLLIALFGKTPEKESSNSISPFVFTAFGWKRMAPVPAGHNLIFQHPSHFILASVTATNILKHTFSYFFSPLLNSTHLAHTQ